MASSLFGGGFHRGYKKGDSLYDFEVSFRTSKSRRPTGKSATYAMNTGTGAEFMNSIVNAIREATYKPRIRGQLLPLVEWYVRNINQIIPRVVRGTSANQDTSGKLADTTRVAIAGEQGVGSINFDLKVMSAAPYARVLEYGRDEQFGTPRVEWMGGGKNKRFRIMGSRQHDYWVPLQKSGKGGESIQQMRDRMPYTFIIPKVFNDRYLVVFDRGAPYQRKGYKGRTPGSKNNPGRTKSFSGRMTESPGAAARGPVFAIYVGLPRVTPTRWFSISVEEANAKFKEHINNTGGAYAKRILGPIFG